MIPYGRQDITQQDIDAVTEVLKSDFLTQGPVVPLFEKEVCNYTGAKYGVAVNSATSALHISCLALGLGKDDWLWTSPITFVASANCGLYCGAKVDFVDIDSRTYNLSPQKLEEKLIEAEKKGKLPKIVIPVHLAGQSCEMKKIYQLSKKYSFKIIEDASHAIGGRYQGKSVGSCQYSDITVFSFHPVKIITTGEGGMAVTNNKQLAEKMSLLRCHGVTRDPKFMTHEPDGSWYYQQIELGFNYRMTDIQAALGISQIKKLDRYIIKRNKIANQYNQAFQKNPAVVVPYQHQDADSSYHLYIIKKGKKLSIDRKILFEKLKKEGIGVNIHYIPLYTQPYYKKQGVISCGFSNSEDYYSCAISLPIFYSMTSVQQIKVISVLEEIMT